MTWWIYCLNKEQPTKAKTSLKAMATSPDAMHDLNKQTKKQRNKLKEDVVVRDFPRCSLVSFVLDVGHVASDNFRQKTGWCYQKPGPCLNSLEILSC